MTGSIRILCLRSYSHGYAGFMEDEHCYMYFNFARHGEFKELMTFQKSNYEDYGHFVGGITKFFPYNFFLKEPIPMDGCTMKALDEISGHLSQPGETRGGI